MCSINRHPYTLLGRAKGVLYWQLKGCHTPLGARRGTRWGLVKHPSSSKQELADTQLERNSSIRTEPRPFRQTLGCLARGS